MLAKAGEQPQNERSEIQGLLMDTCPNCGEEILFGELNGGVCSDCAHMELKAEAEERIAQLATVTVLEDHDELDPRAIETLGMVSARCDLADYLLDQTGVLILDHASGTNVDWVLTRALVTDTLIDALRGEAYDKGANALIDVRIDARSKIMDGALKAFQVATAEAIRIDDV